MISFIIPVYNKGPILFQTLNSLILNLKREKNSQFEIIIVNDGSTDDSLNQAIRLKRYNGATKKIRIFHYPNNMGKGFALRFGFRRSRGETVVFLDGDLDISTNQVLTALEQYYDKRPDILIGSKYHPQSRVHYPFQRFLYSKILKLCIKVLFNLNVTDTQVGLKVFRRSVLTTIFPKLVIKRFAMDLELLVVAHLYGFTGILEMPVVINHFAKHSSTINFRAVKDFSQDMAAIFYRKNILHFYDEPKIEKAPAMRLSA